MALFSKSKKQTLSTQLIAIDLASSGVKVALASPDASSSDSSLSLDSFTCEPYPSNCFSPASIANYPTFLNTCRTALSEALVASGDQEPDPQPKDVVIGVSGENILTEIRTIRYIRPNPSSQLSREELDLFYKRIEKKASEKHPDSELITSLPVALAIDSYRALDPIGFKGEELIVQYLTSFAPRAFISDLKKLCSDLNLYPRVIAPQSYALARACLGPDSDPDLSAILVEVGAQVTNIVVIDSGDIVATTSFNIAGENFSHQIAESLGLTFKQAEYNKLNLEDDSQLSELAISNTSSALSRALSVWFSAFSLALEEFSDTLKTLPSEILLFGGSASLLPLQELISHHDWSKNPVFSDQPRLHVLSANDIPAFNLDSFSDLNPGTVSTLGLLRIFQDTQAAPER